MRKIFLLSCTSRKAQGTLPARELYTGWSFKRGLQYAQQQGADEIYILTKDPEHPVVELDTMISFYEGEAPRKMKDSKKHLLATKRLAELERLGCNLKEDEFIFMTSKHFFAYMLAGRPDAPSNAIQHYQTPLEGLNIIDITKFYKNNLK